MEDTPTIYLLKKKGSYYFITKYIMLCGFCIINFLSLIDSISQINTIKLRFVLFTLFIGLFFLLLQALLSRVFPHKVEIFPDRIKFTGPWGIVKHTIKIDSIKSIAYNEERFVIFPKWPSFNNVTICSSLDPDKEMRKELFDKLRAKPEGKLFENPRI
jgi:hypothetical protein